MMKKSLIIYRSNDRVWYRWFGWNYSKIMSSLNRSQKSFSIFYNQCLINLASGHISIKYGYNRPKPLEIVTACASGAHAIGIQQE